MPDVEICENCPLHSQIDATTRAAVARELLVRQGEIMELVDRAYTTFTTPEMRDFVVEFLMDEHARIEEMRRE